MGRMAQGRWFILTFRDGDGDDEDTEIEQFAGLAEALIYASDRLLAASARKPDACVVLEESSAMDGIRWRGAVRIDSAGRPVWIPEGMKVLYL
jgi:hypothetical protein